MKSIGCNINGGNPPLEMGRDQHGQAEAYQLRQVPVNCAIAPEQQNDVRLIGCGGHADLPIDVPVDGWIRLEGLEIFQTASQAEDGSSAHVRRRA